MAEAAFSRGPLPHTLSDAACRDNRCMDEHQIHIPPSFQDLFRARPGGRLQEPWHHVLARYEVCEDLAQALCPQAQALRADLGVTATDVARKMAHSLTHPAVGLAPEEQQWVGTRLVELMENF